MVSVKASAVDAQRGHDLYHRDCGGQVKKSPYDLVAECEKCQQKWGPSFINRMTDADASQRFERRLPEDRVVYRLIDVQDGPRLYTALSAVAAEDNWCNTPDTIVSR